MLKIKYDGQSAALYLIRYGVQRLSRNRVGFKRGRNARIRLSDLIRYSPTPLEIGDNNTESVLFKTERKLT